MKYFLIAGEPSGDLHAAHLMEAIKQYDSNATFQYFGGDLMQAQGGELLKHYREMAFMGFLTVVKNLGKIRRNFVNAEEALHQFNPDVLILIDYPGFNLRMAQFAKSIGIKTFYYISPKLWAWKTGRVKKVKAFVDEMFTIFPFETAFYKKYNYPVRYVGNPTVDELMNRAGQDESFTQFVKRNRLPEKPLVALIAGSRKQEISLILPVMAEVAECFPGYQFVVAGAPGQDAAYYNQFLENKNIPVLFGQTYALMQQASAALVTSGTATLETAVIGTPQVVCYRTEIGILAEWLRPLVLKTAYFSLVNLIVNREIVRELFQSGCTVDTISEELDKLLHNKVYRTEMEANYNEMKDILGGPGCANRAAQQMIDILKNKK